MKKLITFILIVTSIIIPMYSFGLAAEVNLEIEWAVNNMPTDKGGFRMYIMRPGETDWTRLWEITDPTQRIWEGSVNIEKGANKFCMTTFIDNQESAHSEVYTYEYIEPDTPAGPPVPTVIIRFTN